MILSLLKQKSHKTEIKEIPADSPRCLQTWSGAKEVYWIVDIRTGMYISKDLASVKHFFVEEDFNLVPDPLECSALIGIKCPLYTSSTIEESPTNERVYNSYMELHKQRNSLINKDSSSSQEVQPLIIRMMDDRKTPEKNTLSLPAEQIKVRDHFDHNKQGNSNSQVPTVAVPFNSGFFMNSYVPTEQGRQKVKKQNRDRPVTPMNQQMSDLNDDHEKRNSLGTISSEYGLPMLNVGSVARSRSEMSPDVSTFENLETKKQNHSGSGGDFGGITETSKGTMMARKYFDTVLSTNWPGFSVEGSQKVLDRGFALSSSKKKKHFSKTKHSRSETKSAPRKSSLLGNHPNHRNLTHLTSLSPKRQLKSKKNVARGSLKTTSRSNSLGNRNSRTIAIRDLQRGIQEVYTQYKDRIFTGTTDINDTTLYNMKKKLLVLTAI